MENNQYTVTADDEIDLKELFLSLWSHKILIAFISGAFVFGAGFYALTADKLYSTRSTFTLAEGGNSGGLLGSLGGELGGLAALAGISAGGGSSAAALIERVTSREFILEVAGELDLQGDAFFNGYNPEAKEPVWKANIKQILGMSNVQPDPNKIADWNVIKAYNKVITIDTTSGGAISVTVEHEIPDRAAEIANHIVDKIITLKTDENIENVNEKLRYLSQTLANASEELEDAKDAMKTYSLENSAQAIESFAVGSVMMDDMRAQRDRTVEQLQAILALKTAISAGQTTMQEYTRLREAYPSLDQASFRRILGLSEVISDWTWPTAQSVSQVEDSIRDRIAALEGEITKLEADALRYAASAEEFARLTRDLKVAEATYTVLIEQVKSQSLVAGFTPDNSKIIEIADVPLAPSEPKRVLIVALGLVLGLFAGSAVALVLSMRKGVYYSLGSLRSAAGARHNHKIKGLRRVRGKDLQSIGEVVAKSPIHWARHVVLECDGLANRDPIIIADISGAHRAADIANTIAATAGHLDRKVAVINLSRFAKASDKSLEPSVAGQLAQISATEMAQEYAYLAGNQNSDILYSRALKHILDTLSQKHEFIFLSADLDVLDTVLSCSAFTALNFITVLRKGKTRASSIENLRTAGKIEVALHV